MSYRTAVPSFSVDEMHFDVDPLTFQSEIAQTFGSYC